MDHPPVVARTGRDRHKRAPPQAQQIVLAHQTQHALAVHRKARVAAAAIHGHLADVRPLLADRKV
jgi:hypothetical protein